MSYQCRLSLNASEVINDFVLLYRMQKIIINKHYYGKVELPQTPNSRRIFNTIKNTYEKGEALGLHLLFGKKKQKALSHYQPGGSWEALEELTLFIQMGSILNFDTTEAQKFKAMIEQVNDTAHTHYNISKRLTLINKKQTSDANQRYVFWDIENFANIPAMFNHLFDKFDIPDEHVYLAANPDSLYLYKREWETELYDYGKTLHSFNFTKCDHGKNVVDDLLLSQFQALELKNCDIYIMTYDRELKERFNEACHESNNLYIMSK